MLQLSLLFLIPLLVYSLLLDVFKPVWGGAELGNEITKGQKDA